MKVITDSEEIMYILANEKHERFNVVVCENKNTYVYKLDDDELEKDYDGRDLIRHINNGNLAIIEVE